MEKYNIAIKTTKGIFSFKNKDEMIAHISKDNIIGIILQTENIGMIICPIITNNVFCGMRNEKVFYDIFSMSHTIHMKDGYDITKKIAEQNIKDNDMTTAANIAYKTERGELKWSLPTLLELSYIYETNKEIDEILKFFGFDLLFDLNEDDKNYYYAWSCQEASVNSTWALELENGDFSYVDKTVFNKTILVAPYQSLSEEKYEQQKEAKELTEEEAINFLKEKGYKGTLQKEIITIKELNF